VGIDIRLPIGTLFSLLGLILTAYGAFGDSSQYHQSADVNINLNWGLVLLVFGLVMLVLGRRGMRAAPQESSSQSPHSSAHR
jgi:hypothetical protein